MLLMAIDHVRVFAGVPAGGPDPAVFFTRWVTNFCAPAFVFFAGTSAFLHGIKMGDPAKLSKYLLVRGAMLVLLELTVLRFAWTFNFDYAHYVLAGVIWMLGWCMILMAVLVRLPTAVVGAFGLALVFGHDLTDPFREQLASSLGDGAFAGFWQIMYFGGPVKLGANGPDLAVLYSIVPWIGVMAAGYAFGTIMRLETERRHRWCLQIGLGAIAAFLILRGFNLYGNPSPWGGPQSRLSPMLSFLNTSKYPASLSFLLMTLGPCIALIPALDYARGRIARFVTVFGRVPLFYYLLHIPLIHIAAIFVSLARTGRVDSWLYLNHPMMVPPAPDGYMWSLPLLYAVTALVITLLYFPCRWYAEFKRTHRETWLGLL